jgi:hypothetical protein
MPRTQCRLAWCKPPPPPPTSVTWTGPTLCFIIRPLYAIPSYSEVTNLSSAANITFFSCSTWLAPADRPLHALRSYTMLLLRAVSPPAGNPCVVRVARLAVLLLLSGLTTSTGEEWRLHGHHHKPGFADNPDDLSIHPLLHQMYGFADPDSGLDE